MQAFTLFLQRILLFVALISLTDKDLFLSLQSQVNFRLRKEIFARQFLSCLNYSCVLTSHHFNELLEAIYFTKEIRFIFIPAFGDFSTD